MYWCVVHESNYIYKKITLRFIIKILQDKKVHIISSARTLLCLTSCFTCHSGTVSCDGMHLSAVLAAILYLLWVSMHLNSLCFRVFIHHVESRCWKIVVLSVAVDIMFLVTTCKEGAGNVLLWLLGVCCILQMCSLHVRILLVKLKKLYSAWFILGHLHCVHYYDTFYLIHAWQVNRDCMGSGAANKEATVLCLLFCHQNTH
jgi:hypothetical protein